MTENSNQAELKLSTFAKNRANKRTPVTAAEQMLLPKIVGPVFNVVAAGDDPVNERDEDGKETGVVTERGTYAVMPIAGNLANQLAAPLVVKTKGTACIFSKQQRQQLMWSSTFIAFDNLRLWTVGGQEGLSADNARVVQLNEEDLRRIMNGQQK